MAQASREWEQSLQDLWYLFVVHKWPKCKASNYADTQAQFDAVEDLDIKDGARPEAVRPQQVDKVCRSQVEVNMLETEQSGEHNTTSQ